MRKVAFSSIGESGWMYAELDALFQEKEALFVRYTGRWPAAHFADGRVSAGLSAQR